jgi:ABC-type ATPase with predicted acetyltransferase domain
VAEGFGLDQREKFVVYDNVELKIGPTNIVYITGDSGSGKSVLLKALERDIRNDLAQTCINVAEVQPEPDKPLVETVGKTAEEAMGILSKVGLGDASCFCAVLVSLVTARNTGTASRRWLSLGLSSGSLTSSRRPWIVIR